jgi:hypothetical protein
MALSPSFLMAKSGVSKGVLALALCLLLSVFAVVSYGQQYNNNLADQTLRSNARVNPSTLGMELQIPLGGYPGRGLGVPISLSYSSKLWRMRYDGMVETYGNPDLCYPLSDPQYSELSASGWTTSMNTPYIEYTGKNNRYNEYGYPAGSGSDTCGDTSSQSINYGRRIEIHLPGGESHELRADDIIKSYYPENGNDPNNINLQTNWNATYYAVDGTNLKYVEDSTTGTYRLLMPDGSFFDFSALEVGYPNIGPYGVRKALSQSDRSGNTITYHDANTTYPNGYVTDTLGRNLPLPVGIQAPTDPTTAGSPQIYSLPGLGSNMVTYQLHWKKLKGTTAAESGLTNFSQNLCYRAYGYPWPGFPQPPAGSCVLFGNQGNSWLYSTPVAVFNPILLTEIDLPNGQSYKFSYDIYGKIEKITYPTGAAETFQYSPIASLSSSANPSDDINIQANFGVSQRQVVESTGATPLT